MVAAERRYTGHGADGAAHGAGPPGHPFWRATLSSPSRPVTAASRTRQARALVAGAVTHAAQANSGTESRFDEESPTWPVHGRHTGEKIRTSSL
ncbi:hypothetical protein [Actinacidiphila rubida]|uniref:hypothetical protein n=1 Tax=Actinacidiphila rubida TaxID=310780 RepID=UPI0011607AEA|nr:hypothetical protein [Actinacidiphila rubida]